MRTMNAEQRARIASEPKPAEHPLELPPELLEPPLPLTVLTTDRVT